MDGNIIYVNKAEIINKSQHDENSRNSYQTEFERLVKQSDVSLQILKEVPHNDQKTFNEFGKRPRGRPHKIKNEIINMKKESPTTNDIVDDNSAVVDDDDNSSCDTNNKKSKSQTSNKLFNITLGFLGRAKKIKSLRDKRKKSIYSTLSETDSYDKPSSSFSGNKKRSKQCPENKETLIENFNPVEISSIMNSSLHDVIEIIDSSDDELMYGVNAADTKSAAAIAKTTTPNENIIIPKEDKIEINIEKLLPPSKIELIEDGKKIKTLPLSICLANQKRRRGRPFGTTKIDRSSIQQKRTGQIGRPLSNGIAIRAFRKPKGRRAILPKVEKRSTPGRPRIHPPKPPKIPGRGRGRPSFQSLEAVDGIPRGKPKPIKIPGRGRGRPSFQFLESVDGIVRGKPKKIKVPGRGRGRPSFKSLKKLKLANKRKEQFKKNNNDNEESESEDENSENENEELETKNENQKYESEESKNEETDIENESKIIENNLNKSKETTIKHDNDIEVISLFDSEDDSAAENSQVDHNLFGENDSNYQSDDEISVDDKNYCTLQIEIDDDEDDLFVD